MKDDQPTDQTGGTRGPDGKFTRSLDTAEHDAEAARLRSLGWSYRSIAAELEVASSTAYAAVQRALAATVEEPAAEVRKVELDRLDTMWRAALAVLERRHVFVQQGRVVRCRVLDEEGKPIVVSHDGGGKPVFKEEDVLDDGPVLKAVETLLRIQERRARLLGLDAPLKASVEVTPVDPRDLAISKVLDEARAVVQAEEAALRGFPDGSDQ